jgi:hypothetical protein
LKIVKYEIGRRSQAFERHVPPRRGFLVILGIFFPPLPQWATLCRPSGTPSDTGLIHRPSTAKKAAEKLGIFVGRGFSHDIEELFSSGVLTPEVLKTHYSAACLAAGGLNGEMSHGFRPENYCLPRNAALAVEDQREANTPAARRSRLTTGSCPITSIVSNSGGATACPTIATRVALISNPAFTPSAAAKFLNTWSHAS